MNKFDDIRPYTDAEIPAAMKRIADSQALPVLASFVFPGKPLDEVRALLYSFKTINDFQMGIMYGANKKIIDNSISEFSCDGMDALDRDGAYLFVSNHRDIMLDASLLQNVLVDNKMETAQITFGANLMMNPLVVDIGKSNKMFKVERPGGNIKDFYKGSLHLSEYIRQVIVDQKESVWIAQRNGRTKNGDDKTDQGIIKMFCMSNTTDKVAALTDLHIVPVSVSYEWESCDVLKAIELYESLNVKYIKKPGEDLNSILTGITQQKGRVHFQICPMLQEAELRELSNCSNNEYHKMVGQLIDRRIISSYRLWPNNFIAYDMLTDTNTFHTKYSDEERKAFAKRISKLERFDCNIDVLRNIFLKIYANPVRNKLRL